MKCHCRHSVSIIQYISNHLKTSEIKYVSGLSELYYHCIDGGKLGTVCSGSAHFAIHPAPFDSMQI